MEWKESHMQLQFVGRCLLLKDDSICIINDPKVEMEPMTFILFFYVSDRPISKCEFKPTEKNIEDATEAARKAQEKLDEAANLAKKRSEDVFKQAESVKDSFSQRWKKVSDTISEKAGEIEEDNEGVREAKKRAYEAAEKARKEANKVTGTSAFQSISATVKEVVKEGKDDLFGADKHTRKARRDAKKRVRERRAERRDARREKERLEKEQKMNDEIASDGDAYADSSVEGSSEVMEWAEAVDDESGDTYYYNVKTGETTWDKPQAYVTIDEEEARAYFEGFDMDGKGYILEEEFDELVDQIAEGRPDLAKGLPRSLIRPSVKQETDVGKSTRKVRDRVTNIREDALEVWETSQNPWVYRFASAYDGLTGETEQGQAIKELRRLDPAWDLAEWIEEVQDEIAPNLLRGYLEGDDEIVDYYCVDAASAIIKATVKDNRENGKIPDPTILDLRGVELMAARVLQRAPPILVVKFNAQHLDCIRNKKGEVIHGSEDQVKNTFYMLAMQRNWDEEAEELRWVYNLKM
eukprot:g4105.t1